MPSRPSLPWRWFAGGQSIIGSDLGSSVPRRDIPVFADLLRQGRRLVEALVSSTIRLEDINVAMDHLADGSALRQMVDLDTAGNTTPSAPGTCASEEEADPALPGVEQP
jgi:Zn-dependent alcohol dehydrogenase